MQERARLAAELEARITASLQSMLDDKFRELTPRFDANEDVLEAEKAASGAVALRAVVLRAPMLTAVLRAEMLRAVVLRRPLHLQQQQRRKKEPLLRPHVSAIRGREEKG